MAKKKSSKQNIKPEKEFSSSPFKSLKGLSAFAEPKPLSQEENKPAVNISEKQTLSDDQPSFADEMDFLGVNRLPGRDIEEPTSTMTPSLPPA